MTARRDLVVLVADKDAEHAVKGAEPRQLLRRKKARFREQHIQRQAAVALAEDEPVPFRPLRVGRVKAQEFIEQHAQDFHKGKGRADVAPAAVPQHVQDLPAQFDGTGVQRAPGACFAVNRQ